MMQDLAKDVFGCPGRILPNTALFIQKYRMHPILAFLEFAEYLQRSRKVLSETETSHLFVIVHGWLPPLVGTVSGGRC